MKVIHWNISKKNQPLSGVKRYEDELYQKFHDLYPSDDLKRVQRSDNLIFGSTFLSWIYRYTQNDADIVHATFQTIAPVAYYRRPKKFIITVLDLTPIIYPETQTDISTKIQWKLTPRALKFPDHIITISEFTKNELIRLWDFEEKNIDVVYLGVDHSRYFPMDKVSCKGKFGLNPDEKYILVVASNLRHKRMDITKNVFDQVKQEFPDIKLLKVGYGDTLQGKGIINLGWVKEEDMPFLYNAADIFLHTAEYEGFGLPVLEAMACGVPVVVSKCASLPEIVGDCGELIDLSVSDYLENFVNAIVRTLKEGSTKDGLERVKLFTWEKTARETYRLYKEVMKQN
ncbi:MAG TPA: glycosyltransferase family 1 protein [Methanoregulaceae archaeon]|nr:glycosyltransferase family 1 protein [Methanoregulaceae archaeon]